jgi:hypothetical protein
LDPVEQAVAEAACDFYPVTLIPHPQQPFSQLPVISGARVDAFAAAVATDGSIDALTGASTGYCTSVSGVMYGAAPTPARVLGIVLATAEQHVRFFREFEAEAFVRAGIRYATAVRELCQRGSTDVPALVGFAPMTVPAETVIAGPRGGRIRTAHSSDLHPPDIHEATMVLETTCTLRLVIADQPPADARFFDGLGQLELDRDLVSLAGLLATRDRSERALPRSTWTKVLDPLSPFTGWLTPKAPAHLPSVELDVEGSTQFEGWLRRLEANYHPSVRVAMKRSISAFAERGSPDDALVDLVIALESLFGGRGGELRLRISAALAWLLANDSEGRIAIQQRAKRVYDARSKLVHGEELAGEEATEYRGLAEELVLDAFERLFASRTDLLPNRERSGQLIIGA